jgi:hypothetical protein
MKHSLWILLTGMTLIGCNSCLYRVHEEPTPLGFEFPLKPETYEKFRNYIDTLNSTTVNGCQYTSMKTDESDKILCLSDCECYLVTIQKDKVLIPAVFVPSKTNSAWLTKREQIDDTTINRIKDKFEIEVLSKFRTEFKSGTVSR